MAVFEFGLFESWRLLGREVVCRISLCIFPAFACEAFSLIRLDQLLWQFLLARQLVALETLVEQYLFCLTEVLALDP